MMQKIQFIIQLYSFIYFITSILIIVAGSNDLLSAPSCNEDPSFAINNTNSTNSKCINYHNDWQTDPNSSGFRYPAVH